MVRPLRVDIKGGWYHVAARGIDRRAICSEPRDHEHFRELLEETVARFHVRLHADVELSNHYTAVVMAIWRCEEGARHNRVLRARMKELTVRL